MMKKKLHNALIILTSFLIPCIIFGQTPPTLGVASTFALFTSSGAVLNVGISQITGNVGTNSGSSTGFGNVNGQMHDNDGTSASATFDLNLAYNNLTAQAPTMFPGILLGGGQILTPAVYSIPAVSTLGGVLTLDGLGDPNACFVFQMNGAFSADPGAKVVLINGTKACNVFWKIDGATSLAAGTIFKGTIVCDGAITLTAGDDLEGRALSINGAITVTDVTVGFPIGCGSPVLMGPLAPNIGSTECYALLTADGALTNTGITTIAGDIGTNNGPVSGFNPLDVTGMIHAVPDASTAQGSADITSLYTELNGLACDIELLFPVQFGNSQVLTPHVYCMNAAAHLTDTIFLDAQGSPDAVFVIQIQGALTTSTYANVVLVGGTKSSNVFWKVEGSVDIADYTIFRGTIVANDGAINMFVGDTLDGRALSTAGAITTNNANMAINTVPTTITPDGPLTFCQGDSVVLTAPLSTTYLWSSGESTPSITVFTADIFTVDVVSACGGNVTTSSVETFVNPTIINNQSATICQGDSIFLAGAFQKIQGIYDDTLASSLTCDSIVRTNLTVNPAPITNLSATICQGDSIFLENAFQTAPGIFFDTLTTVSGCDSILRTILFMNPRVINNQTATICQGDSLFLAGAFQNSPGIYDDTLTTSLGCDSIVRTDLIVNPTIINNQSTTICQGDSVFLAGAFQTSPGTYDDTLATSLGCDSIVRTLLIVNPVVINNLTATICQGDSLFLQGSFQTTGGTYDDTLTSSLGCDSIVRTTLTINPLAVAGFTFSETASMTFSFTNTSTDALSYSWTFGDGQSSTATNPTNTYVNGGFYTVTLLATNLCGSDSIKLIVPANGNLEFFNGFSPNGDGDNDYWKIPILDFYPENTVKIVNRWGDVVWETQNYVNPTNAFMGDNANGNELPDGTYFYIIQYGNVEKNGWLFIKR